MPWYRRLAWSFYLRILVLGMGMFQAGVAFLAWILPRRPDCNNPAAQVSALHRIGEAVLALPSELLSPSQRSLFQRVATSLPDIPLTKAEDGSAQVSPCEGGFPTHHVNSENVET